ncbi:hypothetical protein E2C01_073637 [Portunus trituberculatus]|uniref:Uncharacterized protein n=1 Tax=Portunus trituberculatus TaxID=210409 RepID=A0A5B7IEG3_PORTR|nr:hypothetical protein [Portunus trituberculatus]
MSRNKRLRTLTDSCFRKVKRTEMKWSNLLQRGHRCLYLPPLTPFLLPSPSITCSYLLLLTQK